MKRIIIIFSIVSIALFILFQGTRNLDTSLSYSDLIVNRILAFLFNDPQLVSPDYFKWYPTMNYLVRKLAHFTEYAVFSSLFCWYFSKKKTKASDLFVYSLLPTLIIAILDEYLQKFIGRGSLVSDVMIDGWGGVTGISFCLLLMSLKGKLKLKKKFQ